MVATDKFVFIHEPKTGGTFVREALDALYRTKPPPGMAPRLLDLLSGGRRRRALRRAAYKKIDHYHGTCHDIPEAERGKPILSIVRNPFDFYVSFYYYGWWHTHPEDSYEDFGLVMREFPHFPDLSFEEFLKLANTRFVDFRLIGHDGTPDDGSLGYYTTRFIQFYFRHPEAVYPLIDDAYIQARRWEEDMFDVHFMRTHRLNEDLHDYLSQAGFDSAEISSILLQGRVRPEQGAVERPDYDWEKYYTPELRAYVLRKERLLFALFPDLAAVPGGG